MEGWLSLEELESEKMIFTVITRSNHQLRLRLICALAATVQNIMSYYAVPKHRTNL